MAEHKHTRTGNCWAAEVIYGCRKCGSPALEVPACDVCHKHDEPRGSCEECARCAVCDDEVACLVPAGGDAHDALGPRPERRDDPGNTGRIPGAEIVVAIQPQFGVEIEDPARLAGRCLRIRLGSAALQRREGHSARGQRLCNAIGNVLAQNGFVRPGAAAGEHYDDEPPQ